MRAIWKNTIIAESDDTVVVEGNHYFPRSSLNDEYIEESSHTTFCPWKGTANYYSLNIDGTNNPNSVWYYASPKAAASEIENRVAFWRGVEVVK